jgi:four helix bundle protein
MKNYKELTVWKKGIELTKLIYQLAKQFPNEERYGMIAQITRAAVSIPANIAEGSSRNSDKDYSRFLQISLGSAFEVQTYLILAREMNWIKSKEIEEVEILLEEEIKMLHSFLRKLSTNIL